MVQYQFLSMQRYENVYMKQTIDDGNVSYFISRLRNAWMCLHSVNIEQSTQTLYTTSPIQWILQIVLCFVLVFLISLHILFIRFHLIAFCRIFFNLKIACAKRPAIHQPINQNICDSFYLNIFSCFSHIGGEALRCLGFILFSRNRQWKIILLFSQQQTQIAFSHFFPLFRILDIWASLLHFFLL